MTACSCLYWQISTVIGLAFLLLIVGIGIYHGRAVLNEADQAPLGHERVGL